MPQNGVASCVQFCLRSLVPVERCEKAYTFAHLKEPQGSKKNSKKEKHYELKLKTQTFTTFDEN